MECQYKTAMLAVTLEGFQKYFLTLFEVAPLFLSLKSEIPPPPLIYWL